MKAFWKSLFYNSHSLVQQFLSDVLKCTKENTQSSFNKLNDTNWSFFLSFLRFATKGFEFSRDCILTDILKFYHNASPIIILNDKFDKISCPLRLMKAFKNFFFLSIIKVLIILVMNPKNSRIFIPDRNHSNPLTENFFQFFPFTICLSSASKLKRMWRGRGIDLKSPFTITFTNMWRKKRKLLSLFDVRRAAEWNWKAKEWLDRQRIEREKK